MKRLSREELLQQSGAGHEDLADLERRGLLVPYRHWRWFNRFGGPEEYFTEGQVEVVRFMLKSRRAAR